MPRKSRSTQSSKTGAIFFFSYRRKCSEDLTYRVSDRLIQEFGDKNLVLDIDTFVGGDDFEDQIRKSVSESTAVVVVIDEDWLTLEHDDGGRRIDDPNDYVRLEIEIALDMGIPTVPLLLNNAPVPEEDELPDCLRALAKRHANFVRSGRDFQRDMDVVVDNLKEHATRQTEALQIVEEFRSIEGKGNWVKTWTFAKGVLVDADYANTVASRVLNEERDRLERLSRLAQNMKDCAFGTFLRDAEAVEADSAVLGPLKALAEHGVDAEELSRAIELEALAQKLRDFAALLHEAPTEIKFALPTKEQVDRYFADRLSGARYGRALRRYGQGQYGGALAGLQGTRLGLQGCCGMEGSRGRMAWVLRALTRRSVGSSQGMSAETAGG